MKWVLYFFLLLGVSGSSFGQGPIDSKVDSLKGVIRSAQHDSTIIKAWIAWDNLIYISDPDMDFQLNSRIDSLCKINLSGKMSSDEEYFFLKSRSFALNNLGSVRYAHGDFAEAISYFTTCLTLKEKIGDKKGSSACLNNIGAIHMDRGNSEQAIEYFLRSLKIKEEIGDKQGIANTRNNIGNIYYDQGQYDQALVEYQSSMELFKQIGNEKGEAASLINIGNVYKKQKQYDKALEYYSNGLDLKTNIDDDAGIALALVNIGNLHKTRGDVNSAVMFGERSLKKSQDVGATYIIRDAAHLLWETYEGLGEYKKSLEMHKLYIASRDTILSEANQKEIIRQEYKYQYEKQAVADSIKAAEAAKIKDAELETEREENKRQRIVIYFVIALIAVILFFVYMVMKSLRLLKVEKEKVDNAYDELEEKNTEILDSIAYAKRIQSAILPPKKIVREYLAESFILYKPKDIVAGDFYWFERIDEADSTPRILFAACDCTGHGVPGALVSVVCNNSLNRAVREFTLADPGKILDKTRELVIQEFEKSEDEVKDGMDIALCSLKGNRLQYAGANNPLWIIRNSSQVVEEIKANKQPIGKFDHPLPYTTHEIELDQGDTIYVFSDGFADQFGGDKGKKYKAANFKKLLLSIQNESIERQRELIDAEFENWRGNLEQLDDVCIIGVGF